MEAIEKAEGMEVVDVAEVIEVVEVVEEAEAIEVVAGGETSGRAQMQELEEARKVEERKEYYQERLRQINQRIRQEATLL